MIHGMAIMIFVIFIKAAGGINESLTYVGILKFTTHGSPSMIQCSQPRNGYICQRIINASNSFDEKNSSKDIYVTNQCMLA